MSEPLTEERRELRDDAADARTWSAGEVRDNPARAAILLRTLGDGILALLDERLSPAEAGAIQAVSGVERLKRENATLRKVAQDWKAALEADEACCTCEPMDTCPLCRVTRALVATPAEPVFTAAQVREAVGKVLDGDTCPTARAGSVAVLGHLGIKP